MLLTEREQMVEDINAWADRYGRDRIRHDADSAGSAEEIRPDIQFFHADDSGSAGYSSGGGVWRGVVLQLSPKRDAGPIFDPIVPYDHLRDGR